MEIKKDCIFCKIANKELDAKIIAENKYAIAFMDIQPISSGHVLIAPKIHFDNFSSCDEKYLMGVILLTKEVSKKIYGSQLSPKGMNYLSNQNEIAGQIIDHFHLHIIPKYNKTKGLNLSFKDKSKQSVNLVFEKIKTSTYTIK